MAREERAGRGRGWAVVAVVGVMGLSACGRDKDGKAAKLANPVAASDASGVGANGGVASSSAAQTLTVISERSRQPVQASVVFRGDMVDISAPGFLPRRQPAYWPEAVLWEDDGTLPYDVTQNLVYKGGRLNRPLQRELTLSIDPALLAQPRVADALNAALATISFQTPYVITRVEGPAFIELHSGTTPGFLAYVTAAGGTIQGARIEVGSPEAYWGPHLQRAITHEIGHVFGLSDCDLSEGMMCSPEPVLDFSAHEQEVLRKMVQRTPGNTAPDADPLGAGTSSRTTRQVCSLPVAD